MTLPPPTTNARGTQLIKRISFALLIAFAATAHARGADGVKKKQPKEVPVSKTVPAERVSPPKERKQFDGDGPPAQKHPGPVQVGPPQEFRATKASGKKFDLRSLPFVPPEKRERPEREAPAV